LQGLVTLAFDNQAAEGQAEGGARPTGDVRLMFAAESAPGRFLGQGWSEPRNDHVWAMGPESWILLPAPVFRGACLLSLTAFPRLPAGGIGQQRVIVSVNGFETGRFTLTRREQIVCVVPRHITEGKAALCIRLRHPDHDPQAADKQSAPDGVGKGGAGKLGAGKRGAPAMAVAYYELLIEALDEPTETLAGVIRTALRGTPPLAPLSAPALPPLATRVAAAAILPQFHSIGDNCEFGLMQRRHGVEVLGLLRFSSITIANLTRGITSRFAGIATPESLEIVEYTKLPDHDYMCREKEYGLYYHTFRKPSELPAETLKAHEMPRLKLLARKFIEDIELAEHLFVFKSDPPPLPEQIARLITAMHCHGPATLLWVRVADASHPAGTVAQPAPGLIIGYVDRFDGARFDNISEDWPTICVGAHTLWNDQRRRQ
jgi:hypothetical protein